MLHIWFVDDSIDKGMDILWCFFRVDQSTLAPQLLAPLELDPTNLYIRVVCMVNCHVSIVQMIGLHNKATLVAT